MMLFVSIIIVNYNTSNLVAKCIESIYACTTGLTFEIILVDNNSADRTIDEIAACFPDVKFIQLHKNVGFGNACNDAVEIAKGSYLLFLNSDTYLCNNGIKLLVDFYVKNEMSLKLSCLGSELVDGDGNSIHSYARFPTMKEYLKNKLISILSKVGYGIKLHNRIGNINEFYKVDYVTGANLMISRSNFNLASGFDPAFFMYFEETDLQLRLSYRGLQSYLLRGPKIIHLQGASTQKNNTLLRFYFFNSMHLYFKKHSKTLPYLVFKWCWFILDIKTIVQNFKIKRSAQ